MDINQVPSPCFVLEEELLHKNLKLLKRVQEEAEIKIILAFKAFSMWPVFPMVKKYLAGATASSLNEARLCVEEMGSKAHTYSPAYIPHEFFDLLERSSHLTFNSITQYNFFRDQVKEHGNKVSCGLRVNPGYSNASTPLYDPCTAGSRLGISVEDLKGELPEGIEGFHFHTLCESGVEHLEKTLATFEKKFQAFIPQIKWLNVGGGHLITHKKYDVERLIKLLKAFKSKHNIEIIMEPGSAIAWETGVLVTTVLDIVESAGIKTAIIDASFTAHMPDTLEMPYRPKIFGASDPGEGGSYLYRIGGLSCLAGDYLEAYAFEKELKVGDLLVLDDMIHYTMVKTTMFNGVTHPSIAIWRETDELEVIREFHYEDFKSRLG